MRFAAALLPLILTAGCSGSGPGLFESAGPPPADTVLMGICTDAAAARLGVPRHDVLVLAELDGGSGESLNGQAALPGGAVATFSCRFDRSGRLVGFDRTS